MKKRATLIVLDSVGIGYLPDAAQFGDELSRLFFMRIVFTTQTENGFRAEFKSAFQTLAAEFDMTWKLHNGDRPARLLLAVSKESHCLNDLLYQRMTNYVLII